MQNQYKIINDGTLKDVNDEERENTTKISMRGHEMSSIMRKGKTNTIMSMSGPEMCSMMRKGKIRKMMSMREPVTRNLFLSF